jgi:hypothetical protein
MVLTPLYQYKTLPVSLGAIVYYFHFCFREILGIYVSSSCYSVSALNSRNRSQKLEIQAMDPPFPKRKWTLGLSMNLVSQIYCLNLIVFSSKTDRTQKI